VREERGRGVESTDPREVGSCRIRSTLVVRPSETGTAAASPNSPAAPRGVEVFPVPLECGRTRLSKLFAARSETPPLRRLDGGGEDRRRAREARGRGRW
jgi:hypothetical protein